MRASSMRPGGRSLRRVVVAALLSAAGGLASLTGSPDPAPAQQLAPDCPLPREIAATFLQSRCTRVLLTAPQMFYRYYNAPQNRLGRYLTTDRLRTNVEVISRLALNQAWGNKAERMLMVTVPAGSVVYQGIVAPQVPVACYPGGGQQTFLVNSMDPALIWTDGPALVLKPFHCHQP